MRLILRRCIYLALLCHLMLSSLQAQAATQTSWADSCAVVPTCLGVNLRVDFTKAGELEWDLDGIQSAGFKVVRTDMFWQWVEPGRGSYDFRGFDRLVSAATKRGLRSLLILDYSNDRIHGPVSGQEGRQAFTAYAKASAAHYKGQPVYWELWNEANTSHFWPPSPNPVAYMNLAKSVIPAMKSVNPSVVVLGPAMLRKKPPTDSTVHMTETDFMTACFKNGFGTLFNGISYHPYRMEDPNAIPETMVDDYSMMINFISQKSPTIKLPLINSERGYDSTSLSSAETHGNYMVRSYLIGLMRSVPFMVWYSWRDDNANGGYGMITQTGEAKPAYQKLQTLVSELNGYRYVSKLSTASASDYLLVFSKNTQFKIAAWTTGNAHTVTLYKGKSVMLKQAPAYYAATSANLANR